MFSDAFITKCLNLVERKEERKKERNKETNKETKKARKQQRKEERKKERKKKERSKHPRTWSIATSFSFTDRRYGKRRADICLCRTAQAHPTRTLHAQPA